MHVCKEFTRADSDSINIHEGLSTRYDRSYTIVTPAYDNYCRRYNSSLFSLWQPVVPNWFPVFHESQKIVFYSESSDGGDNISSDNNSKQNNSTSDHGDKCYGLERDAVYRILVVCVEYACWSCNQFQMSWDRCHKNLEWHTMPFSSDLMRFGI